ncbi:tetratricopeptide repeat protein 8 [Bicyclus anynana]|uniref:Tetratricopeptide repeat protein 8 n=1 Tax=Bicyclus anynana TaxID=110368 RepID=A0A6J1MIV5_BICAN|nr:tetratricopeptide repeat protein 8 [Bicyclus anynana]
MEVDSDYKILNLYRIREYDKCLKLCDMVLQNKNDRMIEYIRMRAMTIQAKVAGNGYEEVNYFPTQDDLVSTTVAKTPRQGTSFQRNIKTAQFTEGAQVTGTSVSRSGTNTARVRTARTALHTAARASRAATALAVGSTFALDAPIALRLLDRDDKLFIPASKTLFEYVYYCEGNVRKAMEVAFQAQKIADTSDWWWNFSLARCYESLGVYRNVEECLRKSLNQNKHILIYLRLIAMYVSINQPLSALDVCKQGLSVYHEYTPLLLEQARIHEQMGNMAVAVKYYRMVATEDPSCMEAIANIAMYNFYNDQPEIALRYYRRLLATSPSGPEIYNNLGLCCFYCNQWDLTLPCFRQALYFSVNPETRSNIWFNLAHVALSTGDMALARRCLLASVAISEYGPARSALRVLDIRLRARKNDVNQ